MKVERKTDFENLQLEIFQGYIYVVHNTFIDLTRRDVVIFDYAYV